MGSYVPSTPAQRQEMLEAIGLHDFRQLYRDVPEEMLLRDGLDLPEGSTYLRGTTYTGPTACCSRPWLVEPSSKPVKPPRPREPTTTTS